MLMDDVVRIRRAWGYMPPAHRSAARLAASWAGWKPESPPAAASNELAQGVSDLAGMFPDGVIR